MRGIVMRDHMGLTPADHEREAQAQKLMEYKRNLPRVAICPQTRVRCATPDKCDPPYDCLEAEGHYAACYDDWRRQQNPGLWQRLGHWLASKIS
jgi:hypothetical protein